MLGNDDVQALFHCEFELLTVAQVYLRSGLVLQVQTAALDEMFHQGQASAQRYHKALLLMEGLSLLLTDQADILSISKCEYTIDLSTFEHFRCHFKIITSIIFLYR